ncbi:unnamed protein product [Euphydryas editha]|uniref:PiggyBac transposable element-derived protein domain-containing protein n=1 Tax=Euphydryas editha TaxID=104508 RepID=A0AAU9U052_EUPED|nr:unnamed protein product [Euphydryas editha]
MNKNLSDDQVARLLESIEKHNDHDSNTELELESDDDNNASSDDNIPLSQLLQCYTGKNGFQWSKMPPPSSRTRAHNLVTNLPGIKGPAIVKNNLSPLECWELLFSKEIMEKIVAYTNQKINNLKSSSAWVANQTYTRETDEVEIKSFMGLKYLTAIFKSNHEDVKSLWSTDGTGRDIFRITMSKNRFLFLLICLRFDDASTREQRKTSNRLAPISELFDQFIFNIQANYTCSEYVTIDEMLSAFRGKCFFRVYLKSKPAKYGLKIMCLCDAKTHYLYNAFIYAGKSNEPRNPDLSVPTQSVLKLAEPIFQTNRNITADNWFSSVELVHQLKAKGLTYVGTMRKNKRELPKEFLPNKKRQENSAIYGFTSDKTIVSYVPKKNRSVVLISSMHHEISTDPVTGKPEVIVFYNSTKGGVDALDQKCANFSAMRRTRRWPMVIFSTLMNISIVNGHVIWQASNTNGKITRSDFVKELGLSLIKPQIQKRKLLPTITRDLHEKMDRFLGLTPSTSTAENEGSPAPKKAKSGRCHLCARKDDRKCSKNCHKCFKFVCKKHLVEKIECTTCFQNQN